MYKIRKGWSAYNIGFNFHVIINEMKVFLGSKNGNILFCLQEVILWDILVHPSFVCCVLCWPCGTWYWVSNLTLQCSSTNIYIQILPTDLHTFPLRISRVGGGGEGGAKDGAVVRALASQHLPHSWWWLRLLSFRTILAVLVWSRSKELYLEGAKLFQTKLQ